jgi:uncharacterized SAM-dependent methyltransferase
LSKPLIVIGSSTEGKDCAAALQENLIDELSPILWTQLGLRLSHQVLDGLQEKISGADFAAFILSPDDELEMRGEKLKATRDNVLLEFGLARGLLGKDRAFLVLPAGTEDELHIPSDLLGLTGAIYEPPPKEASPEERKHALLDAANAICTEARRLPALRKPNQPNTRRVSGVLSRGSTEALRELADAAIYVADQRHKYPSDLRRYVRDGEVVPSKYLYWTPQGSEHWLMLCRHESYQFYRDSLDWLRKHAGAVVSQIVEAAGTAEIDLVSVGSGDGAKDNVLLRHLQKKLNPNEYIYYYPVDISDTLIVEAIRNALGRGVRRESFRVKALIGDFLKLSQLQAFYEERPATNLFTVLGNTVGNADEYELLGSVSDAMLPGDLVLMEINVGEASLKDSVWRDPVTLEHDFTPLAALNVPFDPGGMEYSKEQGQGIVDGTNSIVASYKEAEIDGKVVKDIKLSIVHYYDRDNFLTAVQERMNVSVIWHGGSDDVFMVLAKREGEAEKQ